MKLIGPINSGAAAGSAGSATANSTTAEPICGELYGVYIRYNDSPPATTDVTIATEAAGAAPPAVTLLSLTDANTSGWFYPRIGVQTTAGAAMLFAAGGTAVPGKIPFADKVKVTIAQADAADSVDCWLLVD